MTEHGKITGHLLAILTIIIWGTTFISTKVLLVHFKPVEILLLRFALGFVALLVVYPRPLHIKDKKLELMMAGAGLSGLTLYYLLENIALTYTQASNLSVILSSAPFFTAILTHLVFKNEKLTRNFFIGFVTALAGICLISFDGAQMSMNPAGDVLAILAAIIWAVYSVLTKKISSYGYPTVLTTRRTFAYGLITMVPAMFIFDFHPDMTQFANPVNLLNILYLGLGASALCFVTWNVAVRMLGVIQTTIYIYVVPVITIITSVIVLHERITALAVIGTILTLAGLIISEQKRDLFHRLQGSGHIDAVNLAFQDKADEECQSKSN